MTFKYREFFGDIRPVATLTLTVGEISVEVTMLVDSGADITMIPLRLGRALGFKEDTARIETMRGISTYGVPYIEQKVEIKLVGQTFPAVVAWVLTEEVPLLLGRKDVFDKFRITFDETERKVEFLKRQLK